MEKGSLLRILHGLALVTLAGSPALGQPAGAPITMTLTYRTVAGLPLRADVYRPDSKEGRPIVLWIHGGGLVLGSRSGLPAEERRLYLQSGHVVVSIDYRLAPETKLAGILDDLKAAWGWVRVHARDIGGDPDRIALVGHSAGGYLALAGGQRLTPPPRAVVAFYGHGDFTGEWYSRPDRSVKTVGEEEARKAVGDKPLAQGDDEQRNLFYVWARGQGRRLQEIVGASPQGLPALSPARNVHPLYPPTLLVHGAADTAVPVAAAEQMDASLARSRVPHRLRVLPGREHAFDLAEGAFGEKDVAEAFGDALAFLSERMGAAPPVLTEQERRDRLAALVDANVMGTHAFQALLARKEGKGDPTCYAAVALTDGQLQALEAHQATLLREPMAAVRAWVEGLPSSFDPAKDVGPLRAASLPLAAGLPVNVAAADLAARAPQASPVAIRTLANLYQTSLEVERDGDRLQELMAFDIALGLPVYVGQLGLPGGDADFLAWGELLAPKTCASPFGTGPAEWQIAGRKIWNWGEKNLHIRDDRVVAAELLSEPDVAALLPRVQSLPPRRIAVLGHSFTMGLHWSSPSAFVPFVTEIFRRENAAVEVRQFERGGLTSTRAEQMFLADALAWKPDTVLLVVANRTDDDLAAFARIGGAFKAAGAQIYWFDDVEDPQTRKTGAVERNLAAAREAGMAVVEVGAKLAAAPGHEHFLCLDGIHMTEAWHRLMAKEWLALLAGARGPSLEK